MKIVENIGRTAGNTASDQVGGWSTTRSGRFTPGKDPVSIA
jgi:hypothetical protein